MVALDTASAGSALAFGRPRVEQSLRDRVGQRGLVSDWNDRARVVTDASLAPSTSDATTLRPRASASSRLIDCPSQRDGIATMSAAASQSWTSSRVPRSEPGPGAGAQAVLVGALADEHELRLRDAGERPAGQRREQHVLPLLAAESPDADDEWAVARARAGRRASARSAAEASEKAARSTPFGTTRYFPAMPLSIPRCRSASLTHTTKWAQRAESRSQAIADVRTTPSAASNDQACGWKRVVQLAP